MRRLAKTLLVAALLVPLGACISLFPKSKPAQLYRFEVPAVEATQASAPVGVLLSPIDFQAASASDRILTITGGEAAYVKDARWVSPAAILFEEAVTRAFRGGRARLLQRGDVAQAQYALKLEVQSFETSYDAPNSAPEVVVAVHGLLSRNTDRTVVGDRVFTARAQASDNRMSGIVPAYDQAVGDALGQLTGWVNSSVK
ncbi:MAG: ABC-type transport auxiliary lipoprotein family protein [Ignavibacteriales bacterium]